MSEAPRRHSPAVYRRRRLVVALFAVIIVAVFVWIVVAQPWRGAAAENDGPAAQTSRSSDVLVIPPSTPAPTVTVPTVTPAAVPDAKPTPESAEKPTPKPSVPSPEASPRITPTAAECTAQNVTVNAVTDQSSYASDQLPKLSIRLTNNGAADCTMNVGTSTQSFTITSGRDTWWRSTDCQTEPADMIVLLTAGKTVSSTEPISWDRTRSSVSTCDGDRQRAPGGGASYHLKVSIGGVDSTGTAQIQLY